MPALLSLISIRCIRFWSIETGFPAVPEVTLEAVNTWVPEPLADVSHIPPTA